MRITTSKAWTKPSSVCDVITPSNHYTNKITASVHNIAAFLSC